jgi:hypothetical protein
MYLAGLRTKKGSQKRFTKNNPPSFLVCCCQEIVSRKNENNEIEKYPLILTNFLVATNFLLQPIPHRSTWSQKSITDVFDMMHLLLKTKR